METIGKIRRWHRIDKLSISQIARRLGASRNTVKKYLKSNVTSPKYTARPKRFPVMGPWAARLLELLREDAGKPLRERRNGQRLYDTLVRGRLHRVLPHAAAGGTRLESERERDGGRVFIPLVFAPGEAYQFDWSYETVELGGQVQPVKVAHLRLAHSRVFLAVAYLREAQEMVFDAHWRAFQLWGGVPRRGIYDNLKTAVDLIFVGKERQYNRRFLQMASHYLIEPVACTPAAGWEKGQVENQVGHVREQVFTPRLKCADLAELNALLERRCVEIAQRITHPEQRERTRWAVFEERRTSGAAAACRRPTMASPSARCGSVPRRWCTTTATATASTAAGPARRCRCAPTPSASSWSPTADGRRAPAQLRARAHLLRSLALRAGTRHQAGGAAQWRAVQGLAAASGDSRVARPRAPGSPVAIASSSPCSTPSGPTGSKRSPWPANWPSKPAPRRGLRAQRAQSVQAAARRRAGARHAAGLQLKEEPRADVGRYDTLLKKLALAALITAAVCAAAGGDPWSGLR